jgi:hypothetical protein
VYRFGWKHLVPIWPFPGSNAQQICPTSKSAVARPGVAALLGNGDESAARRAAYTFAHYKICNKESPRQLFIYMKSTNLTTRKLKKLGMVQRCRREGNTCEAAKKGADSP